MDPAYLLALQKYNLAHFYKASEYITVDFVERYSKKEMRNAYNGLVQAMDPLDNLRNKHRLIIENYSLEKASCDSLLPKVIALEEILRGIGFPSGVHTSSTLCRKDFDASLSSFLPIYKKNERHYYALFGKRLRQHTNYDLGYFTKFLERPLKEFKVSLDREKNRNK
ncbi:11494_t:CDS:1 [Paraglomus brasilianum]|uniref:11494_t:CDS:1 n=1 Tax=Paraglomus brasilianum TaxID=144538 RepID=A0A9N9BGT9_9GLOM|nr:11494_t:CDS:1 [Paraglomus brasilianum]